MNRNTSKLRNTSTEILESLLGTQRQDLSRDINKVWKVNRQLINTNFLWNCRLSTRNYTWAEKTI